MTKKMAEFLTEVALRMAELLTSQEIVDIFSKLHFSSDLKIFRDGFAMFMQHFILKGMAANLQIYL